MNDEISFSTIEVSLSNGESRSVEYALEVKSDRTSIYMRLEGDSSHYTLEFWPNALDVEDGRALSLVKDFAKLHLEGGNSDTA